jgi:hypothetical protein
MLKYRHLICLYTNSLQFLSNQFSIGPLPKKPPLALNAFVAFLDEICELFLKNKLADELPELVLSLYFTALLLGPLLPLLAETSPSRVNFYPFRQPLNDIDVIRLEKLARCCGHVA